MTTIKSYIEHLYYKKMYPTYGPDPLDLLGEKFYYGKVDTRLNAVYVPDSQVQFRLGQLSAKQTTPLYAVNFVADAFNAMKAHFLKAASSRRICQESRYINLEPRKSWRSADDRFDNHQDKYFELFHQFLLTHAKIWQIKNFHDYLKNLLNFAIEFGSVIPLTRTGLIKSKYYSFYSTGLIIDLAEEDYNDNDKKIQYIKDPNFDFFRKAASRHGFIVDKFAPWRLIADISSYRMQRDFMSPEPFFYSVETSELTEFTEEELLEPGSTVVGGENVGTPLDDPEYGLIFNPGTATNYFETYCAKSHIRDIIEIKISLIQHYNQFVEGRPKEIKSKSGSNNCKPTLSEIFKRKSQEEGIEEFLGGIGAFKMYDNNFWLERYFRIRLSEENVKVSERRFKHMLKLNKTHLKYYGMQKAVANVNRAVSLIKGEQTDPKFCQNYDACGDLKIFGAEKFKFGLTSPQQYGYTTSTIQTATLPGPTGGGMGGGY